MQWRLDALSSVNDHLGRRSLPAPAPSREVSNNHASASASCSSSSMAVQSDIVLPDPVAEADKV